MSRLDLLDEQVRSWLGEMGLDPGPRKDGLYLFKYGTTVVMLSLFSEGNETYCRFASIVLKDFQPNLELLQRVLRLNTEVLFGSFLLFEDDTLSFSVTLLGNHLDEATFDKTLRYVAKVSDDWDDELQRLGGGIRASDLISAS